MFILVFFVFWGVTGSDMHSKSRKDPLVSLLSFNPQYLELIFSSSRKKREGNGEKNSEEEQDKKYDIFKENQKAVQWKEREGKIKECRWYWNLYNKNSKHIAKVSIRGVKGFMSLKIYFGYLVC